MKFNDENLNKIFEDHETSLEICKEQMNRISEDIKKLQLFLSQLPLNKDHALLTIPDIGVLYFDDKKLWLSDNHGNKKRLIETKSHIRIKISKHLPDFLKICLKLMEK